MTTDEYLQRSGDIKARETQVREQIDRHVSIHGNTNNPIVWPLLGRHGEISKEYFDLDAEFFGHA